MESLTFTTQVNKSNGAPYSILRIKGDLISQNINSTGIELKYLFLNHPNYIIIDLIRIKKLDICGINYLVKLKIMAMNLGIKLSVKAPYKDQIVDNIKKTKMEQLLDVKYIISSANKG